MVKQFIRSNIRVAVVAMLALALLVSPQAFAQSKVNNATSVLKVSPVRSDISVKPGETKVVTTTVTNLTSSAITVKPIENDFVAGDERGTPALILDADKYAPTHSLKRFMKPLTDVTIAPKEAKDIDVTISVPKDAKAGGYFGAIRFAPTSPEDGGQVNLSGSVASLMLLTVPGQMTEKLNVTDFAIQQDGRSGTFFNKPDNTQLSLRLENKGSVQEGPFGKIVVKNGDKVIYSADFNNKTPRDMVLPDSARRWDVPLKDIGTFGHYTVTATLAYGQSNQTIEVSKSFWVVPFMVIIAAIAGILILIALIVGIWLFLRNYKKRVLRNNGGGGFRH